ncbi:MAG: M1 family metallopeptidase, partial [Myxococcota bacterium]
MDSRNTPRPNARRKKRNTIRLPETLRAERIALAFDLDPAKRRFRGRARYAFVLDEATTWLELHAVELDVQGVRAQVGDREIAARVEPHPECETVVLRFDARLPAGAFALSLSFAGRVRDDLRGLYRGSDPKTRYLATQLCPTDARRFFPCLDEPGTKARYTIEVTAPEDQFVLSNAPVASRGRARDGVRTWRFEETPPLSVYLVAIAVGPFEVSRVAHAGETPIRVVTLPGGRRQGRFAHEAAVESLVRLEKWFGMRHPYAKLDLLAIPDFAFGAMENAGAVFFRDSVLLLDEKTASAEDRLRAAETVAHELAHMWFGNLVTMAWWNDLWLNESFATWMAYAIVDDWKPEWSIWHEFVNRRETALELDALPSSHPIAPPVKTAEEASENFDAITYTKGAAVLRMLERYLGRRVFRDGVRRYIRAHREGAAVAADLWSALEAASGVPVGRIVGPWTRRTGYPVLRATTRRDGRLAIEQSRFGLLPRKAWADEPAWTVPWIGRAGRGRRQRLERTVLSRKRAHAAEAADWLYANADEAGFFRIDHGAEGTAALLPHAASLAPTERIGWVGHQWAMVRTGRADAASLLELIAAHRDEAEPEVLLAIERVLGALLRRLAPATGDDTASRLRDWIALQFGDQVGALGLRAARKEAMSTTRRRARILSIVGGLGGSAWLATRAHAQARAHFDAGRPLTRGAEEIILTIAAGQNGADLQRDL